MSKPVLGYWNIRGLGHPIRFMLAYLGIEVDEKIYALDQASLEEWSKSVKFNLGLDFPNLPYWKEDGVNLTETKAILRYLAREKSKDLMPTKPELVMKADMLENVVWDVYFNLVNCCLTYTDDAKENFVSNAPEKLKQLNTFIGSNKFLLGDKPIFVDFLLYEVLHGYIEYDPEFLKPFPGLEKVQKNFEALPAIANYLASPKFIKSPCFHPMFFFRKI